MADHRYFPGMTPDSEFQHINGLRYHVQRWGNPEGQKLFLLHGWSDCGLTFQFLAEQLSALSGGETDIIAPDWRGFGRTEPAAGSYWFPDYYADLEGLLDIYSPKDPVVLIGHSMGGHIACMYAGIRPLRVSQLVVIEGLGMSAIDAAGAPGRFAAWLDELGEEPKFSRYRSVDVLADKLHKRSPRMSIERARFVATAWTKFDEDEQAFLLRTDPRHKRVNPVLYRHEEVMACWRNITARMLALTGRDSTFLVRYEKDGVLDLVSGIIDDFESALIPDSGHMVHHEQPRALAEAIHGWLK